jgi:acyl carrier protein phosphodiesterase
MNYLAHLYFSDPDPLAWAGSLMGDFVKGPLNPELPAQLSRHIKLHRRIDSYTRDSQPFQTSRRRIDPRFRHGRSVMVDVFYDYLLATTWDAYHPQPLEEFSQRVYAGLYLVFEQLSPGLQRILPRMAERNWLLSYREEWVMQRVLQRLEERIGQRLPLAEGYPELARLRDELAADFAAFMRQARQFSTEQKVLLTAEAKGSLPA